MRQAVDKSHRDIDWAPPMSVINTNALTTVRGAYHPVQVLLHWLVVALILEQYVTSGAIRRTHDALMMGQQPTSFDLLLHMIHNRGGILITGLMALRLAMRWWLGRGHELPKSLASRAAHAAHTALYILIIAMGLTGLIASYVWWPISSVHVVLFKAILILVGAHAFMAFWHYFVRRDDTLTRMAPGLRSYRPQSLS